MPIDATPTDAPEAEDEDGVCVWGGRGSEREKEGGGQREREGGGEGEKGGRERERGEGGGGGGEEGKGEKGRGGREGEKCTVVHMYFTVSSVLLSHLFLLHAMFTAVYLQPYLHLPP